MPSEKNLDLRLSPGVWQPTKRRQMLANIFPISSRLPTKIHYLFTMCVDEKSGKTLRVLAYVFKIKPKYSEGSCLKTVTPSLLRKKSPRRLQE